jgi:hypothetical protein
MRATIKAELSITVDVDDSVAPLINPAQAAIVIDKLKVSEQLTGLTAPKLEGEPVDLSHTLSGTTGSIDLTAAPIAYRIGTTTDLTGKRLAAIELQAPTTNVATIIVKTGASDGYALGEKRLEPGESIVVAQTAKVSTRPTVASNRKILDVSGTSADKVKILAVFGDS